MPDILIMSTRNEYRGRGTSWKKIYFTLAFCMTWFLKSWLVMLKSWQECKAHTLHGIFNFHAIMQTNDRSNIIYICNQVYISSNIFLALFVSCYPTFSIFVTIVSMIIWHIVMFQKLLALRQNKMYTHLYYHN